MSDYESDDAAMLDRVRAERDALREENERLKERAEDQSDITEALEAKLEMAQAEAERLKAQVGAEQLKVEGAAYERLYSSLVDNILKGSWVGEIDGMTVPMVNTSIVWSEVGAALLEKHPGAAMVASFTVFPDQVMWSLRSRPEFDCSEIAKKFGGGGHKNASGFKVPRF